MFACEIVKKVVLLLRLSRTVRWVSGFRLVIRGCNANNGAYAGSATFNANNAVSNANVNIGAPLNLIDTEKVTSGLGTTPHGGKQTKGGCAGRCLHRQQGSRRKSRH
jgi:hypothetical protein